MKKRPDHCAHVAAMLFNQASSFIGLNSMGRSALGYMVHRKDWGSPGALRFMGYAKEDFKKAMREFKRAGGLA